MPNNENDKTDALDPSSYQELQKQLKDIGETIAKRLTEYHAELDELKKSLPNDVEKVISPTTVKLEESITELRKEQDKLAVKFSAPRLSGEDVDKAVEDKQVHAFFKKLRNVYGMGPKLTSEEYADLYPDGKMYHFPYAPGDAKATQSPQEARALVEDATGEILVPESLEKEVMRAVGKLSVVRPLATVKTTTSNRERYRSITELSMAYGTSLEIGGTATESTPTPSEDYQYIEDMHGLAKIGENELDDSDFNLLTFFVDSFARAKSETEDTKFIAGGDHASHEPQGILSGTVVTRITAASSAAIVFEDIVDVMHGYEDSTSTPLPAQYIRNGVFIVHPFTEVALYKIKDSDGRPLWWPSMQAGLPNTLYGKAVYTQQDVPQIATGADVMIFGDVRAGYRIIDRQGLAIIRLNELFRLGGLIGLRAKCRNTGKVVRAAALRILDMA